jgi:hypothetical protein
MTTNLDTFVTALDVKIDDERADRRGQVHRSLYRHVI